MSNKRYLPTDEPGRFSHLIEELGELQAALGKTGRWGLDSVNPELPKNEQEMNVDWIKREMADVRAAMDAYEYDLNTFIIKEFGITR